MSYDKHYALLPDIFQLGGDEAFNHFESKSRGKNLLVLTESAIGKMGSESHDDPTVVALRKIDEITAQSRKKDTENHVIYERDSSGFDLCVIKDYKQNSNGDWHSIFSSENNKIKDIMDKSKLEVISNIPSHRTLVRNRGFTTEGPKFLVVSESLVNKWVKTCKPFSDNTYKSSNIEEGKFEGCVSIPSDIIEHELGSGLQVNQFVRLINNTGTFEYGRVIADLKKNSDGNKIVGTSNKRVVFFDNNYYSQGLKVNRHSRSRIHGVKPRGLEQRIAMNELLLDDDVNLVHISGGQGCGKTLLSYVCLMDLIMHYKGDTLLDRNQKAHGSVSKYNKMILLKSNTLVGGNNSDLGFLKGDLFQKIKPYLMSYSDSHEESNFKTIPFMDAFCHPLYETMEFPKRSATANKFSSEGGQLPRGNEAIELAYFAHARGRSFSNRIVLVDELQDMSPYIAKTIISRMASGSKIVLVGDPKQVDNSTGCTRDINGFTASLRPYLNKPYSGSIYLGHNERHQMSEDSEEILSIRL